MDFVQSTSKTVSKTPKSHSIELDNHRQLAVSGVLSVPIFTDKSITVELDGETLIVLGHDLSVKALDVETGKLNVTGFVTSLKYSTAISPKSFLKRLFK